MVMIFHVITGDFNMYKCEISELKFSFYSIYENI